MDRSVNTGVCLSRGVTLSRVGLHAWEEPCISNNVGSGTVFFAGCNLHCRFCQNYDITVKPHGVEVSPERLADVFLYVQDLGASNVNLVTPSHCADGIARALTLAKPKLTVPVVYNTSSYEKASTLQMLDGLVDVYLADLKFCSRQLASNMCHAPDYFQVATAAIEEMRRQQPKDVFDDSGMMQKGLIVRHLVLPSCLDDTKLVLDWIAQFDKDTFVSLMSQYFPARKDDQFPFLNRRLFQREYDSAVEYFFNLGLHNGFTQDVTSATRDYLPDFFDDEMQSVLAAVPHIFG